MYGLFECMSRGCVAQKGDHAKIYCYVIQERDRRLTPNRKNMNKACHSTVGQIYAVTC